MSYKLTFLTALLPGLCQVSTVKAETRLDLSFLEPDISIAAGEGPSERIFTATSKDGEIIWSIRMNINGSGGFVFPSDPIEFSRSLWVGLSADTQRNFLSSYGLQIEQSPNKERTTRSDLLGFVGFLRRSVLESNLSEDQIAVLECVTDGWRLPDAALLVGAQSTEVDENELVRGRDYPEEFNERMSLVLAHQVTYLCIDQHSG